MKISIKADVCWAGHLYRCILAYVVCTYEIYARIADPESFVRGVDGLGPKFCHQLILPVLSILSKTVSGPPSAFNGVLL